MPSVYIHMSGRNLDAPILALNGLRDEEKKEALPQAIVCPKCKKINPAGTKFCGQCAGILDIKTACEIQEQQDKGIAGRRQKRIGLAPARPHHLRIVEGQGQAGNEEDQNNPDRTEMGCLALRRSGTREFGGGGIGRASSRQRTFCPARSRRGEYV